jgi:hypothetical protein
MALYCNQTSDFEPLCLQVQHQATGVKQAGFAAAVAELAFVPNFEW